MLTYFVNIQTCGWRSRVLWRWEPAQGPIEGMLWGGAKSQTARKVTASECVCVWGGGIDSTPIFMCVPSLCYVRYTLLLFQNYMPCIWVAQGLSWIHVLKQSTHFIKTYSVKSSSTLTTKICLIFEVDLSGRLMLSGLHFLFMYTNINPQNTDLLIWT